MSQATQGAPAPQPAAPPATAVVGTPAPTPAAPGTGRATAYESLGTSREDDVARPTAARRDRGLPALRGRHRPAARTVVAGQPHRRRRHRAADPGAGHQD